MLNECKKAWMSLPKMLNHENIVKYHGCWRMLNEPFWSGVKLIKTRRRRKKRPSESATIVQVCWTVLWVSGVCFLSSFFSKALGSRKYWEVSKEGQTESLVLFFFSKALAHTNIESLTRKGRQNHWFCSACKKLLCCGGKLHAKP